MENEENREGENNKNKYVEIVKKGDIKYENNKVKREKLRE